MKRVINRFYSLFTKKAPAHVVSCVLCLTAIFFSTAVGNAKIKKSRPTLIAIRFRQAKIQQLSSVGYRLSVPINSVQAIVLATDRPQHMATKLPLFTIGQIMFAPGKQRIAGVRPHTTVILALEAEHSQSYFFKVTAYKQTSTDAVWNLTNINLDSPKPTGSYLSYQGPIQMFLQTYLLAKNIATTEAVRKS